MKLDASTTPNLLTPYFKGSLGATVSRPAKMSTWIAILVSVSLTVAVSAHAQEGNDPPDTPEEMASQHESLNLLRQSRYVELDGKMNGIQRSYEFGRITDERLLHEFRAFYDTDPALAGRYDAWVEKMPRSYSALVARGIYLRYLGKQVRGGAYIEDTPRQQIEAMSTYLARAMRDYNASLTLTKKPLLTYHSIIAVTMLDAMIGGDDLARRMLNESIRVDPRNFVVRYKYFASLQTRWGGSLQQMLDFEKQARAAGLSDAQLRYFANMLVAERRWVQTGGRCCK
jgi:Domain of unknown function (DUF4034)